MPISRISLQVETSVILSKTGMKAFPVVWSINTFFQGLIDSNSEDKTMKATQKLMNEFVQNYKYANQEQKAPVFYIYD